MLIFVMVPEIFNSISSSYPTKSSQNRCPSILKLVLDQSFLLRLVLQVKTWFPSCMQHFSVYIPGPSHLCDEEQSPNVHLKSEVDHLFIETSKQNLKLLFAEFLNFLQSYGSSLFMV